MSGCHCNTRTYLLRWWWGLHLFRAQCNNSICFRSDGTDRDQKRGGRNPEHDNLGHAQGTGFSASHISYSRQCEAFGTWPIFIFNPMHPRYLFPRPNYSTLAFYRYPSFIRQLNVSRVVTTTPNIGGALPALQTSASHGLVS